MRAIVYDQPMKFELRDIPKPVCKPNEVLVKIHFCGICKTDVHQHTGQFIADFPLIPGHEMAGVVEAVGEEVTDIKVGDRVTVDDTGNCGTCYFCQNDMALFCENFKSKGGNMPGAFAEYVVADFDKVFKLADHISLEEGCFTEPTACAVHGLDVIDPKPGNSILLFGAGPTGIILAQLLNRSCAGDLVVAAPSKDKLDILNELGIKETFQISRDDAETNRNEIMKNYPYGFDIVVDTTGSSKVAEEAIKYVKKNGKLVLYAVYNDSQTMTIKPYEMMQRQIHITGSFAQYYCFPRAVNAINKGIVDVKKLVTEVLTLEEYGKGLEMTAKGGPGSLKVLIKI